MSLEPVLAEHANQEGHLGVVNQEVHMLAPGIIQPSLSPWEREIVMVKKKNIELRYCCDFHPINQVTIKDPYPLLRVNESLSRLGKAKIYTSMGILADSKKKNRLSEDCLCK